ncbi:hypothetical protein VTL71DRAFT_11132 [Oculimacula yallundae]|uniref:Uncharacterized protein n=1 Tax=Oculimacula yallundae TaxID=86028 RepID=A0ABR4CWI3_9HELO
MQGLNRDETSALCVAPSPFPGARHFILRRDESSESDTFTPSISLPLLPHTTATTILNLLIPNTSEKVL